MDNKSNKIKQIYTILVSILALIFFAAFLVVFNRAGYDKKLLVKLGLSEPVHEVNWAVAGWTNTLAKLNYDADVVFLGDSITRGSDFREYFPDKRIVNLGYAGDTISGMTERANMVGTVDLELVFVMGG